MGIEQRKHERIVIPGDVLITLSSSSINCHIENISNSGAYLKVNNPYRSYDIKVGDNATFSITTPDIQAKELSGRILRRCIESDNMFLAVYFFQPYTFDF